MHFTTNAYDTGSYNQSDVYTLNTGDFRPIRMVFGGQITATQDIIDTVNRLAHASQQVGIGFDSFAALHESLMAQGAFMTDFSEEFSDELDDSEELTEFLDRFAITK